MTSLLRIMCGVALMMALVAPSLVRADDDDTIDYRRHIMKTMGEQAAVVNMILQQKAPVDSLNVHLKAMAATAGTALKAFEPKVPGGHAKPNVWANWADFSKRMNELAANLATLAKSAETGGPAAVAPKVQAALTCKSCHDVYSEPLDK